MLNREWCNEKMFSLSFERFTILPFTIYDFIDLKPLFISTNDYKVLILLLTSE